MMAVLRRNIVHVRQLLEHLHNEISSRSREPHGGYVCFGP